MIKKILLTSISCFVYSHFLLAETGYDFAAADESGYLSCVVSEQQAQLKKYSQFVRCEGEKICVKAQPKDVCFEDTGTSGEEGGVNYSLAGVMPENKAVVIRYLGYEEYFDYFISLTTGETVFDLPTVFNGHSQTKRSLDKNYMVLITTNDGYDGDPFITELAIIKLEAVKGEGMDENKWQESFGLFWKEPTEGFHSYDIQWLNDTTVKISALSPQTDYLILQRMANNEWQIKEKNYAVWREYQYSEGE